MPDMAILGLAENCKHYCNSSFTPGAIQHVKNGNTRIRTRGPKGGKKPMTDEERAKQIRAYIAGIERIKKNHPKGSEEYNLAMDKILLRLSAIWKLYRELQDHGRGDLWEEFREWTERLSQ